MVALGIAMHFSREVKRGLIIPYAKLEFEAEQRRLGIGGAPNEPKG